jgi:hypothetical protein
VVRPGVLFVGAAAGVFGATTSPRAFHHNVAAARAFAVLLVAHRCPPRRVPFLVAWEFMAMSAYLLVVFE